MTRKAGRFPERGEDFRSVLVSATMDKVRERLRRDREHVPPRPWRMVATGRGQLMVDANGIAVPMNREVIATIVRLVNAAGEG